MARFEQTISGTIADNATWVQPRGNIIIIRADKAFEFSYEAGTVYFPLLADTTYQFDGASAPTFHAPSGGGTVTITYSVGHSRGVV